MSLFEDPLYKYAETYFVLFKKKNMPPPDKIRDAIQELGSRYDIEHFSVKDGALEAMTIICDHDFAGIDLSYVEGDDVSTQIAELQEQLTTTTFTQEEMDQLKQLPECDARIDLFHFERLSGTPGDDILDPGALLKVIETVNWQCKGIALDPNSLSMM